MIEFNSQQLAMDVHSCEVNWAPLSDAVSIGFPKRMIQLVKYECLGTGRAGDIIEGTGGRNDQLL